MNDQQVEALGDCPFCGGRLFRREYLVIEGVIGCRTCGATITRKHQPECDDGLQRAAEAWNTRSRTPSAPDVAMREALKKSAEGWANVIEMDLIPPRHVMSASILRDECKAALSASEAKAEEPDELVPIYCKPWRTIVFVKAKHKSDFLAKNGAPTPAVDREAVARGMIEAERVRHIREEGWDASHDDAHDSGELLRAGMCYICEARLQYNTMRPDGSPLSWPWETKWWKPTTQDRNFVKGGALLLAERDRLQRLGRPHSHVDQKITLVTKWLAETLAPTAPAQEGE